MRNDKPTVVLVDDSSSVRAFFERVVSDMDVVLVAFSSADEAMAYLAENTPDLLFLDIIMPEKDGLTFLQELRRMPIHAETATVVISSKDYAQDKQTAKALGVLEFVTKPMPTKVIEQLIVKYAAAG